MTLRTLLRKELLWLRRNRWAVALVFLLVPALFAFSTATFTQTLPRDVPVAVVPGSEAVTLDERQAVRGVAGTFSKPVSFDSGDAARRALAREEVYGIVAAPHGLYDAGANVTLTFTVSGSVVPYEEPSGIIAERLRELSAAFPATVAVERVTVGPERTLPEYLLVSAVTVLLLVYAFTYVPYHFVRERRAFDRVRVEASLSALLASKAVLFAALVGAGLLTVAVVAAALEYRVALLRPAAVAIALGTFLALAAASLGVTFLTRFSVTGRFLNVAALVGAVLFSNLVYPAGFFSATRGAVAGWSPLYHVGVVLRGVALAGRSPALFADRLLALGGVAVAALAWLALAVRHYRRRA